MKFVVFFAILLFYFRGSQGNYSWYDSCTGLVTCGSFTPVGFPFWGGKWRPQECGYPHLKISCADGLTRTLLINGMEYVLLNVNELDRVIRVARKDYYSQGTCLETFVNITLNWNEFRLLPTTQNLTVLYGCQQPNNRVWGKFNCKIKGISSDIGYYVKGIVNPVDYHCDLSVVVPSLVDPEVGLKRVFEDGFQLNYTLLNANDVGFCQTCQGTNGTCGYDYGRNRTVCVCPYGSEDIKCKVNSTAIPPAQPPTQDAAGKKSSSKDLKLRLIIGLCVGGVGIVVVVWVVLYLRNRHSDNTSSEASSQPLQQLAQFTPSRPSPNSILEEASTLGVKLFDCKELKEATDDFADTRELGEGAFATVYYGKLQDGQEVAVKRFYHRNEKLIAQYKTEVSILARLRHENLLILLGFTSRHSEEILLVYEYISNGTLADNLYGTRAQTSKLSWPLRVKIAVETAEGLYHLHQNEVVHRDVKTSNILLTDSFQAKVADFGLARVFPRDASHVMTDPYGTPGYVDPHYFRGGHLTEKSDVYSFGVVLLELISSRAALDSSRKTDDANLSIVALDVIQNGDMDSLVDPSLRYGVDRNITQTVDSVAQLAIRCIQDDVNVRPQMVEVLESLKEVRHQLGEYEASTSGSATTGH